MFEQHIINESQFNDFIKVNTQPEELKKTSSVVSQMSIEESSVDDGIKILREYLCRNNKGKHILWLQKVLIDTCYVKLALSNPQEFDSSEALNEPIIYYYSRKLQLRLNQF